MINFFDFLSRVYSEKNTHCLVVKINIPLVFAFSFRCIYNNLQFVIK